MMRTFVFLLALLLSGPALAAGTWTNQGACTAASYAALPAADDDSLCTASDTGLIWRYSSAAALWLPPDVHPSALLVDYDGSVLPSDDDPAWTAGSVAPATAEIVGGELVFTDSNAAGYFFYKHTDLVNYVNTNNVGMIGCMRVTAQSATADGFKAYMAIRVSSEDNGAYGMASGAILSGAANIAAFNVSAGGLQAGVQTYSMDNAITRCYLLTYIAATRVYELYELGQPRLFSIFRSMFDTNVALSASTVAFGASSTATTATSVWGSVQVFIFD